MKLYLTQVIYFHLLAQADQVLEGVRATTEKSRRGWAIVINNYYKISLSQWVLFDSSSSMTLSIAWRCPGPWDSVQFFEKLPCLVLGRLFPPNLLFCSGLLTTSFLLLWVILVLLLLIFPSFQHFIFDVGLPWGWIGSESWTSVWNY